ncbi:MAG: D-tyrosyl-tRNA(Tyr) deacylase [Chloroflexi bacterium]|nr:D-tyrosyl-tRNA(Tyr) deacylase [Chloroflexota bacterium]MBT4072621.1 D-tyrosyl-tRNA(Tyr) deacylase [Chloroflexota bacterium]MBT4513996.1 D-tyrosyl-tRNA(Tyr) deacylase [Chloroflexota bacterium]MBT5319016.1 D-tyrosyl-tRNA(Tyr) deacylase [Chloroflexota bacterium]MBT6682397.1 D-tyrosyl-tRNA(Tyr) deacylase [Chloroflexota bacterium]
MRAVVQRVRNASVTVDGAVTGSAGTGLAILVGVTHDDGPEEVKYLRDKITNLRIFHGDEDDIGFERSALEVEADILLVSQFTLYASTRKGRRPGFTEAAPGPVSEPLFEQVVAAFKETGLRVETGVFGAKMMVELANDGPATFILDTADRNTPRRG